VKLLVANIKINDEILLLNQLFLQIIFSLKGGFQGERKGSKIGSIDRYWHGTMAMDKEKKSGIGFQLIFNLFPFLPTTAT